MLTYEQYCDSLGLRKNDKYSHQQWMAYCDFWRASQPPKAPPLSVPQMGYTPGNKRKLAQLKAELESLEEHYKIGRSDGIALEIAKLKGKIAYEEV